jgi:acetyltransferase-like isoleucine patch superfamily enzyme
MFWLPHIQFRSVKGWLYSGYTNVKIGLHSVIGSSVTIKEGVTIEDYVRIFGDPRVIIGRNVYINCFTMMLGDIEIEDDVLISQHVVLWGRSHRFEERDIPIWVQHGEGGQGYKRGKIVVKKGAWIGPHAVVMRGVTIGEGAVIGAGAIVAKDIPDYAVAFGMPAEVQYYRGDDYAKAPKGNESNLRRRIVDYWDRAGICSFDSSTCSGDRRLASCTNFVESRLLDGLLKRHGFSGGKGLGIDIGAGLGRFTAVMAGNLGSVHALEPAGNIYQELTANCAKFPNVKTFPTDFESFDIQDYYDVAVVSGLFYLYPNDMVAKVLTKFAKHSGPGSIMVVRDFLVKQGVEEISSSYIDGGFCYYRDISYWTKLAREHGFELVEVFQSEPSYPAPKLLLLMQKLRLIGFFDLPVVKRMMYWQTERRRAKGIIDFPNSPLLTVFMVMRGINEKRRR